MLGADLILSFYLQREVESRHQRESIYFLYFIIIFLESLTLFHREFKKVSYTCNKIVKCE